MTRPSRRPAAHVCGWSLVDGQWRCTQDFYASGLRPDTACGSTWEPVAGQSAGRQAPALWDGDVTLTRDQKKEVYEHVLAIEATVKRNGYRDRFPPPGDAREQSLRGYAAELAVALRLGLPWHKTILQGSQRGKRKRPDVGTNVEVRTWPNGRYCPVRDGDDPTWVVVLVTPEPPVYRLERWAIAGDVMRDEYRHDDDNRHPFWRVPAEAMQPFPIPTGVAR